MGYTYEIPKFGQSKLLNGVVAGWTFGGLLEYASGAPIPTPTATTNQSSLWFQNTLMNRVPDQPLYSKDLNCPLHRSVSGLRPECGRMDESSTWDLGRCGSVLQRLPV